MNRSKVPSIYHEHCTKPGPTSNAYLPPPEARLFKSRSAPNSPFLERKPLIPRSPRLSARPATKQVVEKRVVEHSEKRSSKVIKVGRSNSFQTKEVKSTLSTRSALVSRSKTFAGKGQAEQRNSLGKTWHPGCLRCEQCGKRLNPGQHSEHRGIPYCNIPCYSLLFGPGGYGRGGTESYQYLLEEKLTEAEQEALRNEIIPKLKCYNMFFENRKALQLSSREVGGKLLLEGVLKVYWGLRRPVTLAGHRLGDWRRRSQKEHTVKNARSPTENKEKPLSYRGRTSSVEKIVARRRSFKGSNKNGNKSSVSITEETVFLETKSYQSKTTFIPPYGTSTNLRVTSRTRTQDVVKMLLSKFQILAKAQKFHLYVVYDHGPVRKLLPSEFPLHCRLLLGPDEGLARIFVMEADDGNTISAEVAQYIHFATPILNAFLEKFKEEEERVVEKIKEKYAAYRSALQERLRDISTEV